MNLKKLGLGLVACGCLTDVALAEKSGVYTSFGFQYSQVKTTVSSVGSGPYKGGVNQFNNIPLSPSFSYGYGGTYGQSNMYGFDLDIGYKAFFGKTKRNGLRFFAFYDYGYSNPMFDRARYNLNAYGAGMDYLFNFINKEDTQVGIFVGFSLAGNSWITQGHPM
ncbi:hypothetical protein NHP200010_13940 [Helicobacter bizzozeronii]|nr:hypothetical protein NHP200010_13940 [Helicobacter bizzozeronii]